MSLGILQAVKCQAVSSPNRVPTNPIIGYIIYSSIRMRLSLSYYSTLVSSNYYKSYLFLFSIFFDISNKDIKNPKGIGDQDYKNNMKTNQQYKSSGFKIKSGLKIKLDYEFCKDPIFATPHVYKFANYERFFCCKGCLSGYKQKYSGRIEYIKRKFEKRD